MFYGSKVNCDCQACRNKEKMETLFNKLHSLDMSAEERAKIEDELSELLGSKC